MKKRNTVFIQIIDHKRVELPQKNPEKRSNLSTIICTNTVI